jgi:integrase
MRLASTGLRRGEALALRWVDIDFVAARLSVRRSVGVVKHKGQGEEIVLGPPKGAGPGSSTWTPRRPLR